MVRRIFLFIVLLGLTVGCGGLSTEEQAAQAAHDYYERLSSGDVEAFMAGKAGSDSIADEYRALLTGACRQYLSDINERHGGISQVDIASQVARHDTAQHITYAFLLLTFRDSTQEEITVPMVSRGGEWRMK